MSKKTSIELRKIFLYQVYLRNHTQEGTIQAFRKDLDRIRDLGVDMIYFMPIHPIGVKQRKGTLGCPYAVQDYMEVNPEYGTKADFLEAIRDIHAHGMTVMIDIVYNHSSPDSRLMAEHPEWFLQKDGSFFIKEPHWSDVQDFDYAVSRDLWVELTDTLIYWMENGVDGFRFDVSSFLPIEFLEYMEKRLREVNPDVVLLSESIHGDYCRTMRNRGYEILSEAEIYQVFDMAYDYDVQPYFRDYLLGKGTLNKYLDEILRQEEVYPKNYIKMRNLENHDFGRFADFVDADPVKVDNWTAFNFFHRGSKMIYAGEEFTETHQPSLFEREPVQWTGRDISPLIQKLATIMKLDPVVRGVFDIVKQELDVICVNYKWNNETLVGIFNVGNETGQVSIKVPSGEYQNLLSDTLVEVINGTVQLTKEPLIFAVK